MQLCELLDMPVLPSCSSELLGALTLAIKTHLGSSKARNMD